MAIFLTQFLAATIYPTAFILMCCTETTSNKINFRDRDSYESNWISFRKFTVHGLPIKYQTAKISFVEEFPIISLIKTLPVLFRADDTHFVNVFDI